MDHGRPPPGYWNDAHQYRREMIAIEPVREEIEVVDPNTEEGRAAILEQLQQLPQDLILAALNVKAVS